MNYKVTDTELTTTANKIRAKGGTSAQIEWKSAKGFADAVDTLPDEATLTTKSITANGTYAALDDSADGYSSVTVAVPETTLVEKSITENGTYDPADDSADGYSSVTVNVSGGNSTILSGADEPTSGTGSNGNVYLQCLGVGTTLPSGYTVMGALQVDASGPYIDTGVNTSNISAYKIRAQYIGIQISNTYMFGAYVSYKDSMLGYYNGRLLWKVGNGGTIETISIDYDTHVFEATATELLMDNVNVGTPNWSNTPSLNACLFSDNRHSPAQNLRIYECEIYEDDVLTRRFIPAMRDSDSVLGMYDTVNDVFYTNAGSGNFEAVESGTIIDAFVKVDGAWTKLVGANISDITT